MPGVGQTVPIEQLLYAVGEVETGHIHPVAKRYTTVNPIGAHGRYQVMRANIAPWTREVLGRSLTPAQFLADPRAQDKVAAAKLGESMRKYGSWKSAVAVWFSGQPDWNSSRSDGHYTVRQYIDEAEDHLATGRRVGRGDPGSETAPAFDVGGLPGTVVDSLTGGLGVGARALGEIARSMLSIGNFATFLLKLALPSTWVRIVCGLLGAALLIFGLVVLGREARG